MIYKLLAGRLVVWHRTFNPARDSLNVGSIPTQPTKIWKNKIKMFKSLKRVKQSITNLIKWFPVIWNDRDWDHQFFHIMLRKKLSNMEDFYRNHGCHLNAIKDADNIKICVNLLDRIIQDKYHEMFFDNHDKKWGDITLMYSNIEDNKDLVSVDVIRSKTITEEDKKQERKEFESLFKKQEQQRLQDIEYLYDMLKNNILCWWD